jgi:hypothetical protein
MGEGHRLRASLRMADGDHRLDVDLQLLTRLSDLL